MRIYSRHVRTFLLAVSSYAFVCSAWRLLLPLLMIYIDLEHLITPPVFVVVFDRFHLVL